MVGVNDIVITGIGCVTPIGIGREAFWDGLRSNRCGVKLLHCTRDQDQIAFYGAAIDDFEGKKYVTPRKALKVMSREVQLAYSSAQLAWQDAGLDSTELEPDRMGVIYGSEMIPGDCLDLASATIASSTDGVMDFSRWGSQFSKHIFPLWMLRNLPNMPACHVGIAIDARGPNNTIAQEEVSSLLALSEAASVIQREQADLMVVGAVGSRVTPTRLMYRAPGLYDQHPLDEQVERCIPFDARRRGIVPAEGAGTIVIERRSHAVRRGAQIYGTVLGSSNRCGSPPSRYSGNAQAIEASVVAALESARVDPHELSHVSAQGYSQGTLDVTESQAIRSALCDVPVTAYSSYFGTAGAACGILELIASLLATRSASVLPIHGYRQSDPACELPVCTSIQTTDQSHFVKLSFTPTGQAAAVVIQCVN